MDEGYLAIQLIIWGNEKETIYKEIKELCNKFGDKVEINCIA